MRLGIRILGLGFVFIIGGPTNVAANDRTRPGDVTLKQLDSYILDYRKAVGVEKLNKLTWLLHIYNVKKLGNDGIGISPSLDPLVLFRFFAEPGRFIGGYARTNIKETPIGYGPKVHPLKSEGKQYRFLAEFYIGDSIGLSEALRGEHPGGQVRAAYFAARQAFPNRRFFEIYGEYTGVEKVINEYGESYELPGFNVLAVSGFNGFNFDSGIERLQQSIVFDEIQIEKTIKKLKTLVASEIRKNDRAPQGD